jgi:hypothetical protein
MTTLPETRTCSAIYLRQMLVRRHPDHAVLFADMFAVACLLHHQGERRAGVTLMTRVFDAVRDGATQPYLAALLANLPGNEVRFAQEIEPHGELGAMCVRARVAAGTEPACAR